jgi:hypothetical protein
MAARRVKPKGRARIALGIVVFLVLATAVVGRRSLGVDRARALVTLDEQRMALEAERTQLLNELRSAGSLARLGPQVARRGLHTPLENQFVELPRVREASKE